ncbi:MAG: hypothetical protein EVA65_04695 [Oceanococcus sp.]|nr:MAG: hypothetical protein EVA65_04695 [Oceanococcus sp.]
MASLIRFLLVQELYYGAFLVVLAAAVALEHGWESGVRIFFYCLIFMQPIIFWVNRKVLMAASHSAIQDKK